MELNLTYCPNSPKKVILWAIWRISYTLPKSPPRLFKKFFIFSVGCWYNAEWKIYHNTGYCLFSLPSELSKSTLSELARKKQFSIFRKISYTNPEKNSFSRSKKKFLFSRFFRRVLNATLLFFVSEVWQ